MGAVWQARYLSLDIPCALKFLHPEAADQAVVRARFEREAKAAAQLRSPNVVQVLDHGVWQDMPFIAMELLEGEDLQQRLRRVRVLDPRDTFAIVAQVARALTKAHAVGLVHRDLKPGNIFIVRDDDREVAKVLDFGVAKNMLDVSDSRTQTGALMGTPYYMSPEQARGVKEVDHRSDLWALGVITYQCLVGRLPFPGDALGDLLMKIIAEPLPNPSDYAAVPPGFPSWWLRAAARDPAQRFQSAKEMAEALGVTLGISVGMADAYMTSRSGYVAPASGPSLPGGLAAPTPMPSYGNLNPQWAANPATGNPANPPSHPSWGHPAPPSGYGPPQGPATPMPGSTMALGATPIPGSVTASPMYGAPQPMAPQTASPIAADIAPPAIPTKERRGWVVPVVGVLVVGAAAVAAALVFALARGDGSAARPASSAASSAVTAPIASINVAAPPLTASSAVAPPSVPSASASAVGANATATAEATPSARPFPSSTNKWPGGAHTGAPPAPLPTAPSRPARPVHDDGI